MDKTLVNFTEEDVKLIAPPYADLEEALEATVRLATIIEKLPWIYVKLFVSLEDLFGAVLRDILGIKCSILNSVPLCEYCGCKPSCPLINPVYCSYCRNKSDSYSLASRALRDEVSREFKLNLSKFIVTITRAIEGERQKKECRPSNKVSTFQPFVGGDAIAKAVNKAEGIKALLASIKLWEHMVSLPDRVFIDTLADLTLEEVSKPDNFIVHIKTVAMEELGMFPMLYMCPLCDYYKLSNKCPLSRQTGEGNCEHSCTTIYDYQKLHKGPKGVYKKGNDLRKDDWSTYRVVILSFLNRLKYHYYRAVLDLVGLGSLKI